jgi:sensor histidine kinase regulating citrate/malate metabolism
MTFAFDKTESVVGRDRWTTVEQVRAHDALDGLLTELNGNYMDHPSQSGQWSQLDFRVNDRFTLNGFVYEFIDNAHDSILIRQSQDQPDYRGQIDISVRCVDGTVRVGVADNGAGIDSGVEPYLFKSLKHSSMLPELLKENSGLVLAGSQGIGLRDGRLGVESLGGSAGYCNRGENNGAVFWYEFPLKSIIVPRPGGSG